VALQGTGFAAHLIHGSSSVTPESLKLTRAVAISVVAFTSLAGSLTPTIDNHEQRRDLRRRHPV
jgi:hypothetical protein